MKLQNRLSHRRGKGWLSQFDQPLENGYDGVASHGISLASSQSAGKPLIGLRKHSKSLAPSRIRGGAGLASAWISLQTSKASFQNRGFVPIHLPDKILPSPVISMISATSNRNVSPYSPIPTVLACGRRQTSLILRSEKSVFRLVTSWPSA